MILVLNCGSQSIKWKLFDSPRQSLDRLGLSGEAGDSLRVKKEGEKEVLNFRKYEKSLKEELGKLVKFEKEIKIIGHRVVHGGEKFREPVMIGKKVVEELKKFNNLAPLHNPFNILGIRIAQKFFPKSKQVAVFDTDFYKDLPPKAYIYALPEKIRKKFGFRRYGFHGISHEYVAKTAAKKIKRPFEKLKIITCHLGGGSSITATKFGRAVDTSMGFTPLEGVVMMTRAGSIDPGVILELVKKTSLKKAEKILNHQSGIKGLCKEDEMLKVLKKIKRGDKKAKEALDIFVYWIQKYIGSYFAVLNGCDLLVFTGTIGFRSAKIRNMICRDLDILRKTKIIAIKPNEELAIAEKVKKLI